jgi:hypothetical protein
MIFKGGIVYSPADELLAPTAVAVDFYQFINGIKGAGPQGFQPPIAATNLEDSNYSPMWRILFVAEGGYHAGTESYLWNRMLHQ